MDRLLVVRVRCLPLPLAPCQDGLRAIVLLPLLRPLRMQKAVLLTMTMSRSDPQQILFN